MERMTIIFRRYFAGERGRHRGFVELFVSKRLLHGAATALLGVFVPIYLYTLTGERFYILGGVYALLSAGYALFLVSGMKITNRIGFSRALVLGSSISIFVYTILFFMNEENVYLLLVPFIICGILFRIFHWVPYHVDFTKFTNDGERGRDISLTFATIAFLGVIGPILAGFIITHAGYTTLFGTAILLLVAATISYAFVPEVKEKFIWTFRETVGKLFSREYRNLALGEFASGAEAIVTLVAWPIFLYEILKGNLLEIGAVSTIIVGLTIVLQLFLGKYLDDKMHSKEKTLQVGSVLYALGWVIKIFVLSATQVFFVGLYHNVVKIFTNTPYSTILYDMSADQGSYIDEFSVMREMSSHTGRFFALVIMTLLTLVISIKWVFIVGAVATLLLNVVYRTVREN